MMSVGERYVRTRSVMTITVWGLLVAPTPGCARPVLIDGVFTPEDWTHIEHMSPAPSLPADPTNRYADDPRAAELGQMLFFEPEFSGPIVVGADGVNGGLGAEGEAGRVSCASCHVPSAAFADDRSRPAATSLGIDWTSRNTPTVVNSAFEEWLFWDGRADTLWSQALGPTESSAEMGGDRLRVAHVIYAEYRDLYDEVFDPDLDPALDPASIDAGRFPPSGHPGTAAWDGMSPEDRSAIDEIFANYGKAIDAYERRLVWGETAFDRYVAGDHAAISTSAKRGLRLFIGRAACAECHAGPLFSDGAFHNIGIAQAGEHVPAIDEGRLPAITQVLEDPFNGAGAFSDAPVEGEVSLATLVPAPTALGAFRTATLRGIALTAPYGHNGSLATLEDVVRHYDDGGAAGGFVGMLDAQIRPLGLSDADVADLVAFLETLDGGSLPAALLVDTSRP